jgi:hypothetical protein
MFNFGVARKMNVIRIEEVIKIIKENNHLINHFYNEVNYEINEEPKQGGFWIYIQTKYKKLPNKRKMLMIKNLFRNADDILFVNGEPCFWSIHIKESEIYNGKTNPKK